MQLPHRITIDLLEFIKSGKFDYIKLGQTKEWILNNFPNPDNFSDSPEVYASPVWWYGNIEFHFDKEELILICSDHIDTLDGGESLELQKWIFANPGNLSLGFVVEQLNQQRIDFRVEHKRFGKLSVVHVIVFKSGVVLGFSPVEKEEEEWEVYLKRNQKENSNLFHFHGFSLNRT